MKELKVATLMLLMLMGKTEVDAEVIKCQYSSATDLSLGSIYYCNVLNTNDLFGDKVKIEAPIEAHLPGKTNENVNFLMINSASGITKFPTNINVIFSKLQAFSFAGCSLTDITQNDLKVFQDLKGLNLNQNQLRIIRADTFKANLNLEFIYLAYNPIIHIDQFAFTPLTNLKVLTLNGNYCPSLTDTNIRSEVETLTKQIEKGICQSIEFTGAALFEKFKADSKKLMDKVAQFQLKAETCEKKMNQSIKTNNNVLKKINRVSSALSHTDTMEDEQKTFWDKVADLFPSN